MRKTLSLSLLAVLLAGNVVSIAMAVDRDKDDRALQRERQEVKHERAVAEKARFEHAKADATERKYKKLDAAADQKLKEAQLQHDQAEAQLRQDMDAHRAAGIIQRDRVRVELSERRLRKAQSMHATDENGLKTFRKKFIHGNGPSDDHIFFDLNTKLHDG